MRWWYEEVAVPIRPRLPVAVEPIGDRGALEKDAGYVAFSERRHDLAGEKVDRQAVCGFEPGSRRAIKFGCPIVGIGCGAHISRVPLVRTVHTLSHVMPSAQSGAGSYIDFGYSDVGPLSHAEIVFPAVLSLAGKMEEGCRVLDIGCGNGLLSGLFLDRGCHVVGVDLSEEGVAIARSSYPAGRFELVPADGRILQRLGEPPFDLVVSTEVIEHLYDPSDFLKGSFGALRPGGRAIVSTPYHGYWKNVLIAATGKFDQHVQVQNKGGHIKFWSRATLERAMQREGFGDFEFRGVGRIPLLWKSMVVAASRPRG